MAYGISLSEIMRNIYHLNLETQTVSARMKIIEQENVELNISLNRLNTQIQKQTLYKKKLATQKCNIDKTKTKCEDELRNVLDYNRQIKSNISFQFEEIQRLMAKKDDKFEFIDQQKKINNGNCTYKKTTLISKKLEETKDEEYYKPLCIELMIDDILSNEINFVKVENLTNENHIFNEKYDRSIKDLKNLLEKVEICKYTFGLYFDNKYDSDNKTEIIKVIMSTFNQLITNGFMCYSKSKARILKANTEFWTVSRSSRKTKNTAKNNNQEEEGFKSLQY